MGYLSLKRAALLGLQQQRGQQHQQPPQEYQQEEQQTLPEQEQESLQQQQQQATSRLPRQCTLVQLLTMYREAPTSSDFTDSDPSDLDLDNESD
jgi:hypothetical protein